MQKSAKSNMWIWIVGIVIVVLLYTSGSLSGIFGGAGQKVNDAVDRGIYRPSDQETTVTFNIRDGLATTDTNANGIIYLFRTDTGAYVGETIVSAGTATKTLNYGLNYDYIFMNDTGAYGAVEQEYAPAYGTFLTDSGEGAQKAVNLGVEASTNATIVEVRSPEDWIGNVTGTGGSTQSFEMLWKATSSNAVVYKPVITVEYNTTSIDAININGASETACPGRLTTSAGDKAYKCFQVETVKTSSGTKTTTGTVTFDSQYTSTKNQNDYLIFNVIDTQAYKDSGYVTTGKSAFHEGTENKNTLEDIGRSNAVAAAATEHANTVGYLYFDL